MKIITVIIGLGLAAGLLVLLPSNKNVTSQKIFCNILKDSINMKKITKTDVEWQNELTPLEFDVTRHKGTERAFTGAFHDHHENGVYTCKCCELPLFKSDSKFNSGTGWPSFFIPVDKAYITEIVDKSHGMTRTEVTCARCDAHLGHKFPDGPKPTGMRYCINSVSLDFCNE